MRSLLVKSLLCFFVLALALHIEAQTNPHTQIRWPANCNTANMVYTDSANTCINAIVGPQIDPGIQVNWPPACNAPNMVYNFASNTCFNGAVTITAGTTTTLAPGSPATVTQTGTFPNYILNFGIPTGTPGGSLSYPGVLTDNARGLAVEQKVTAGGAGGTQIGPNGVTFPDGTVQATKGVSAPLGADMQTDGAGQTDAVGVLSPQWGIFPWGDSNCAGYGMPAGYGWPLQIAAIINSPLTVILNGCKSGNNIADFAATAMVYSSTTDYANPATFVSIGLNTARFAPTTTSYATATSAEYDAGIVKLATSTPTDQYFVTDTTRWTQAGTWTTQQPWMLIGFGPNSNICVGDTFAPPGGGAGEVLTVSAVIGSAVNQAYISAWGNGYVSVPNNAAATLLSSPSVCTGQSLQITQIVGPTAVLTTSGAGATLTSASLYTGPSGVAYLTYPVGTGFRGTFNIKIDGTVVTDTITGSSTLSEDFGTELAPANFPFTTNAGGAGTNGLTTKLARFTGITPGTHVFVITQLSGTIGVSHLTIAATKRNRGINEPHAISAGVITMKGDATVSAQTAFYNALELTESQRLVGDGLHVKFVNTRDSLDPNRDYLIGAGNPTIQNCVENSDNTGAHLDSCGHLHLAGALAFAAHLGAMVTPSQTVPIEVLVSSGNHTVAATDAAIYLNGGSATLPNPAARTNQLVYIENRTAVNATITCAFDTNNCPGVFTTALPGCGQTIHHWSGGIWTLYSATPQCNPVATTVASTEAVTFSSAPTFSNAVRQSQITLSGNITTFTLATPTATGTEKTLIFCQDATGGWTVTPPFIMKGFFTIGTTASKCSSQHFTYNNVGVAGWFADSPGVINE